MPTTVVTPPDPIVSLDEAKAHVRFSAPDDDDYLTGLVATVTAYLDGPLGILGRALGAQVLEESRRAFPGRDAWCDLCEVPRWCADDVLFIVTCPPILELQVITYLDAGGAPQTMSLDGVTSDATSIQPNGAWPDAVALRLGAVKVRYRAGYETVPAPIRHAILLMVGTLYANREATIDSAFAGAAAALLAPYQRVA